MPQAATDSVANTGSPPVAPATDKTPIDFTADFDTSELTKLTRSKVAADKAAVDETDRALREDRTRAANFLDREGVGPNDLQKWDADRERAKYETNPVEAFGSFASVFAIAASAFTHAPMENALNGSAAAIKAVREQDDKAYDRAFAAFKENMDLAIKRHQMMHENYQDAVTMMSSDLTRGEAKLRQEAARFGDQKALIFLEHGMAPELFQMLDARSASMDKMADLREKITKTAIQDQVFHADPRSHSKDPNEVYQAFQDSRGMDIKTPPDSDMYHRIWSSDEMKNAPPDQRFKLFDKKWEEYNAAKYANRGGSVDKQTVDLKATELMEEANKRGETLSLADARLQAQAKVAQAKQQQLNITPQQLSKIGWDDATIDAAARTYNKSGVTPRYLGSRAVSAAIMGAIQNRATELMKEDGITPEQRAKNWQKFSAERIAIQRFESGPQGNTIRSLGVVVDHLATLRHLALALDNGDIPAFNKLAQTWAEQTGSPIPTNFDEAKQIVGTEIIKALGVAGAGTQAERAEASESFARWRSPSQLLSGIDDVMRPLMLGQLRGLERQFVQSTHLPVEDFYAELGPEAEKFLRTKSKVEKPVPTQADIDYAKAHPDVVDKFKAKFGRDP